MTKSESDGDASQLTVNCPVGLMTLVGLVNQLAARVIEDNDHSQLHTKSAVNHVLTIKDFAIRR